MPQLFPTDTQTDLPLFCEPAFDLLTGRFQTDEQGNMLYLYGNDALKLWIQKALHPQSVRFAYHGHTAYYGHEFDSLLCQDFATAETLLPSQIQSLLLSNPYIRSVGNFTLTRQGSRLLAAFLVETQYDNFMYESEVITLV